MILKVYKEEGETPLERLNRFKAENPEYQGKRLTYAGRLDPLAEGVMIFLSDKDLYKKDDYLLLPKEYEFEILWGFETDTHDVLGLVKEGKRELDFNKLEEEVEKLHGAQVMEYPSFSSRKVNGKPLFLYAKEGKINEIEIPKQEVFIKYLTHEADTEISGRELLEEIKRRIGKVLGDFRQEEVIRRWEELLDDKENQKFKLSKFKISSSSGTYVRKIAHELGKRLGGSALAWKIKRTKMGEFGL